MLKTRVLKLINILLDTTKSLQDACDELGFEEDDLSYEELDTLYDHIFQCGCCGCWTSFSEEMSNEEFGLICESCFYNLED